MTFVVAETLHDMDINVLTMMEWALHEKSLRQDVTEFLDSRMYDTNTSHVLVFCSLRYTQELLQQVLVCLGNHEYMYIGKRESKFFLRGTLSASQRSDA